MSLFVVLGIEKERGEWKEQMRSNVDLWGIWMKGIWEFFVVFMQHFCKSEIISKQRVQYLEWYLDSWYLEDTGVLIIVVF